MELKDLENRFSYHKSDTNKDSMMNDIRLMVLNLAISINLQCPDGREKSLAMTHLEEVMFWANSSIARS